MTHPLVDQLRFTRREWRRGLEGLSEDEGARHFGRMNCASWIVGHLAWQEQGYWLYRAQGQVLYPQLQPIYAFGAPMSTPSLAESLGLWQHVTLAADPYLDGLTTAGLQAQLLFEGQAVGQSVGSALRRMTYHYWYHTGEVQAIRQMLGHTELPQYVGEIEEEAPYRAENP
jgi:hypothetical protein